MRSPLWSSLLTAAVFVSGLGVFTLVSGHPNSVLVGTLAVVLGVALAVVATIRLQPTRGDSR